MGLESCHSDLPAADLLPLHDRLLLLLFISGEEQATRIGVTRSFSRVPAKDAAKQSPRRRLADSVIQGLPTSLLLRWGR